MEGDKDETQSPVSAAAGGSSEDRARREVGDTRVEARTTQEPQQQKEVEMGRRSEQPSCAERNAGWLAEIGNIQEAGYVFVLREDDTADSGLRLAGASANITSADWWRHERSAEDLIRSCILRVFNDECVRTVKALVRRHKASLDPHSRDPETLVSADFCPFAESKGEFLCCSIASSNPGMYLLEVEPKHGPQSACPDGVPGLIQVAQVLRCFTPGSTPEVFTRAVCDSLIRSLPGYDRVMVYRFAADKSGEVIHESIRSGCQVSSSYLNLRFPAADIPDIARKLLLLNRTRVIEDTHMEGSPLRFHLDSETDDKLDLSTSTFRAPATCHLQYLRNMGVKASLTAAITVDDELWGMFSFHGYTRKVLPTIEERTLVEMAASVTGTTLARYNRETNVTMSLTLTNILAKLSKHIKIQDFLSAEHMSLLEILDVDTIVLCEQYRKITVYGNKELSLNLAECNGMLHDDRSGKTLSFRSVNGRGIAYFSVRSFLVAFVRGSVVHRVAWAGKPDTPLIDHKTANPRESFERFVASASAQFPPWSNATKELLGIVRHGIAAHLYAEALPADLEEIFAHVSHELRTPFHGVMGSLEILEEGLHTMGVEERQSVIRSAIACGNCMLTTLGDILDIAKDRNNTELSSTEFAVGSPILRTMSAMKQFGAQKSLELITNIDPAVGSLVVVGDERRIKHIVQNLVNNAIKFTPVEGKVCTSLLMFDELEQAQAWWGKQAARFESHCWKGVSEEAGGAGSKAAAAREDVDDKTRWFVYSVEDTGVGVSRGDLLLLTSAYRQLSHGASKAYAGTGLGLHISDIHIRTMSGSLGIASTLGGKGERKGSQGTIFACVLPLRVTVKKPPGEVDGADGALLREGQVDPAGIGSLSRRVTFLVADDQAVNVKILRHKILKAFDAGSEVQVVYSADGEMALDMWAAARRAAEEDGSILAGVFMDFHMPNVDGMECTARIRRMEAERGWPHTPIIGCTADPTGRTKDIFDKAGGDEVLFKPWRPGQVESMCRLMVERALLAEKDSEKKEATAVALGRDGGSLGPGRRRQDRAVSS
eukprot:g6477.t1